MNDYVLYTYCVIDDLSGVSKVIKPVLLINLFTTKIQPRLDLVILLGKVIFPPVITKKYQIQKIDKMNYNFKV